MPFQARSAILDEIGATDLDDCVSVAHVRSCEDRFAEADLIQAGSAKLERLGPVPRTYLVPSIDPTEVVPRPGRQIGW